MNVSLLLNSLAGGGAQRVAINLAKALSIRRIFLLEKDISYELPPEVEVISLTSHTIHTNSMFKTLYIPLYSAKLSRFLSNNDIVISMLERANYVNIFSSTLSKHKSIISVRTSQLSRRAKIHPYNLLNRFLYPRANYVVAISQGVGRELERFYGVKAEKIKVIYNPLDLGLIQEKLKENLGRYEEIFAFPVIITVGRLTKPKGQWYLLRIFKELRKYYKDLKLVILGDGELKDYLYNLSLDLGLKTFMWDRSELRVDYDVFFLGFQKNPFKLISRAKLFVFLSLWEGLPNALVEAMACGVPVISSDCRSGPREILAPNTSPEHQTTGPEFAEYGFLMPVFDGKFKTANEPITEAEKKWIDAIKLLLSEDILRDRLSTGAKVRARDFELNKIAEEWKKLIEEVRNG
ncbi:MAG: glycosyltransferase [Thermodesulfovibrio sp.]|nr:glycosyltransferase [Thermodesulfovibrio sp.]